MLKEFKQFVMTGNVLDLAIAVLLAGAIGLVVSGFVSMVMMPIIGHFAGGMDFEELRIVLSAAIPEVTNADGTITAGVAENAIMYGKWINTIINLIIVGFVLFMIVRSVNKFKKKEAAAPPAAPPAPTKEEVLLGEIRDLLKK